MSKCKHPNSRKTKALAKKAKRLDSLYFKNLIIVFHIIILRIVARNETLTNQNLKRAVLSNKIQWFLDHLDPNFKKCTPQQTNDLIERYCDLIM